MDTTGSAFWSHAPTLSVLPLFSTSPIAAPVISFSGFEIPGDDIPYIWPSMSDAPSYHSAYSTASDYGPGDATKGLCGSGGEGGLGLDTPVNASSRRREETRRQRNESEQHRRDGLFMGFARLKEALPVSYQHNCQTSLLKRAVTRIQRLEALQREMQSKLTTSEMEADRLRQINEALMLKAAGTIPHNPHFEHSSR
ncbi:hypothetical protein FRC10_010910 [Ceratobasidium sp. 414]|nr:hypothetical protein FRC10_010910 [Ceratobasidium sp. 414]